MVVDWMMVITMLVVGVSDDCDWYSWHLRKSLMHCLSIISFPITKLTKQQKRAHCLSEFRNTLNIFLFFEVTETMSSCLLFFELISMVITNEMFELLAMHHWYSEMQWTENHNHRKRRWPTLWWPSPSQPPFRWFDLSFKSDSDR